MGSEKQVCGGCMCGEVRFTATPVKAEMTACHCSMCRKWSGGVFMPVQCGDSVKVEDENVLGVYKSSDWGERCFCKNCGTTLFWRMQDGSHCSVAASAFDDSASYTLTSQIFIDEKPETYAFANDTQNMTGPELFALFAANSNEQENPNG